MFGKEKKSIIDLKTEKQKCKYDVTRFIIISTMCTSFILGQSQSTHTQTHVWNDERTNAPT